MFKFIYGATSYLPNKTWKRRKKQHSASNTKNNNIYKNGMFTKIDQRWMIITAYYVYFFNKLDIKIVHCCTCNEYATHIHQLNERDTRWTDRDRYRDGDIELKLCILYRPKFYQEQITFGFVQSVFLVDFYFSFDFVDLIHKLVRNLLLKWTKTLVDF